MKYFNKCNWFKLFGSKKDKNDDFVHQSLSKKRRGQSFKGHSQDIWYHKNDDGKGSVNSYNQYYSGTVTQSYNIDKHQTVRNYQIGGIPPQWLVKKLNEMSIEFNMSNHHAGIQLEDNPKIAVYRNDWSLNYFTIHDGFNFTNHYDDILELKQLQLLYRKFRNRLKNEDITVLKKYCTVHNNEIDNHVLKLNKNYLL